MKHCERLIGKIAENCEDDQSRVGLYKVEACGGVLKIVRLQENGRIEERVICSSCGDIQKNFSLADPKSHKEFED